MFQVWVRNTNISMEVSTIPLLKLTGTFQFNEKLCNSWSQKWHKKIKRSEGTSQVAWHQHHSINLTLLWSCLYGALVLFSLLTIRSYYLGVVVFWWCGP